MLIAASEGSVHPDYFQFYLATRTAEFAADSVTGFGYEAHLEATTPRFVYVGTLKKYSGTPIRFELHDREPEVPAEGWQHVVEVSLVGDGEIRVLDWGGSTALSVSVPSESLRLRVKWAGLEAHASEDGTRDDGSNPEHLELQAWPAPQADRRVLRWWNGWLLPQTSSRAPDGREQIEGVDEVVRRIQGRMRSLPVFFGHSAQSPPLPGGGPGVCTLIWGDPSDGSWWIDGYAARRVLRPISDEEVRGLLPAGQPMPPGMVQPPPDPRWTAMLARVGFSDR